MPTNGTTLNGSSSSDKDVYIVSAVRTPIGAFNGSLSTLKATELASIAIKKALEKIDLAPENVEKVIVGQAIQANSGQAAAKQALMGAGLPSTCRDCLINEVCASGMQSIISGVLQIKFGANVLVAAGMESMTNVPKYPPNKPPMHGEYKVVDGVVVDGLTDSFNRCHMGDCAEYTAKKYGITRDDQDKYAIESYKRAIKATKAGLLAREICAVEIPGKKGKPPVVLGEDEELQRFDESKFATLSPCFDRSGEGTITAANASSLSDGAAACVLMSSESVQKYGVKPLAKIVSFGEGACDPKDFATSPVDAIKQALHRAGLKKDDISLWEINEAFSVVALANMKDLGLQHDKVNVNGGGVSIGHPLGMSGTRIVNALAHQLEPGQYGCAAICRGGGGSAAMIIKKI